MPNITLKRFMIFNSSEGHHESREGDKLLFHWTKEATDYKVSLTEQIDDICLCDASVNVSNRLNCDIGQFSCRDSNSVAAEVPPSQDTDDLVASTSFARPDNRKSNFNEQKRGKSLVLIFESTLVLIVEVEPSQSIWMAVHVAPPTIAPSTESSQQFADSSSISSSSIPTMAVGSSHQHTDPSCIPADAIEKVMNNIYARFCLLNGSIQMIAEKAEQSYLSTTTTTTGSSGDGNDDGEDEKRKTFVRNRMRLVCENYFNSILPDIHLNSIVSNVASLYNYVLYLDLNPLTLMKVNSFINHLVCVDAVQIRHTIVIFNDQLLWSSLNMYDTRLLYNYLVSVLIRDALQEELSKEVDKVRIIKEDLPVYLTDTSSSADCSYLSETSLEETAESTANDLQQQQPQQTRDLRKLYLTVFRSSNNMTFGLILNQPDLSDLIQKCEQVLTSDSRIGVIPLASLAQSVGQNFLRANSHLNYSQPSHQQSSTPQQQQSQASATGSVISNSSSGWRKQLLGGSSNLKSLISPESKYVFMDRLDVSISWPFSMDMQNKEHLLLGPYDNGSLEHHHSSSNKKLRLIKYLIELEPELQNINDQCGSRVCEFFGRTLSDSWLTVTNSKYKTIYSVHNVRNSGLNEAQQSAMNLKSAFASIRRL